ncbi:MAG: hypothetical protein AAF611_13350 [Bacteroidota bacterium]
MKRIHVFEFEDLQWFPDFLRNYMTDFLQFVSNKAKIYLPVVDILVEKLKVTNTTSIVDLASGGGGGLLWLNTELLKQIPELTITLTDYYPNVHAFKHAIAQAKNFNYIPKSIDARDVPEHVKGFRTQFLSFHHFKPKEAQKILQNTVDANTGIAIFEVQDRTMASFIGMLLSPINVFLTTPFIKPFKFGRLFFTYLFPIIPIVVLWDGVISCLRTYSVPEMKELVNKLANKEQFDWSIGVKKQKMYKVLFLIGTPKSSNKQT